jgi:phosphoglycolate phosphatase
MPYDAVLFDLDGTLLDTVDDLADATNATLEHFGFPPHPVDAYKLLVGGGIVNLFLRALPADRADDDTLAGCIEFMRSAYAKRWDRKTRPYEGVPEMLDALADRGVPMVVLSNKPHDFTNLCVDQLLPNWTFELVLGVTEARPTKPDQTGVREIVDALGIPPERFLYVGDTGTDMRTAVAAGMHPVGVTWGFRSREELLENGAQTLIDRPEELLGLL